MPDNDNPQVVAFVNDKTRRAADRIISAIRTLRQHVADYSADGIGPLVVGDQTLLNELIADGSQTDGRTRLLGYDVDNFNDKCIALLAYIDGQAGMEAALTKPSVNTQPVF